MLRRVSRFCYCNILIPQEYLDTVIGTPRGAPLLDTPRDVPLLDTPRGVPLLDTSRDVLF